MYEQNREIKALHEAGGGVGGGEMSLLTGPTTVEWPQAT